MMINFSKTVIADRFMELYKKLNETDKNSFAYACTRLLNENYIYGQRPFDEDLYRLILRLRETIEYYFALVDYELECDDTFRIFSLKSRTEGTRLKLKKLDTVLLLVLAKLYSTKSLDVSSGRGGEVNVTMSEVNAEIEKTRILSNRNIKGGLTSAIKTLKKYKIIYVSSTDVTSIEAFKILPTILYVVRDQDLETIENKLNGLSNNYDDDLGDEEDETQED